MQGLSDFGHSHLFLDLDHRRHMHLSRFLCVALILAWPCQLPSAAQATDDLPITARLVVKSAQVILDAASAATCDIRGTTELGLGSWHRPRDSGTYSVEIDAVSGGDDNPDLTPAPESGVSVGEAIIDPGSNGQVIWSRTTSWPSLTSSGGQTLSFTGAVAYRRSWNVDWVHLDPLETTRSIPVPAGTSMPRVTYRFGGTVTGISSTTVAGLYSADIVFQFTCQ